MTSDDSGMSQRERRRQQFQKNKPAVRLDKSDLRKWIGPLALLFLVGGVVAIMAITDSDDASGVGCSGHYHYGYDVFIDGEKLLLNAPGDKKFVDSVGHNLHMHDSTSSGSGLNLIHAHYAGGANVGLHPENCFSYDDTEDMLSMDISSDAIILRAAHGDDWAGTYSEEGNNTLKAYGRGWDDTEWNEVDLSTLGDKVPPVSSRIAFIYGEQPADVQAFLDANATPYPVTTYPPGDADSRDPAHYTSFDELQDKP